MWEDVQGVCGQSITPDDFCDFQMRVKKVDLGGKGSLVTGRGVTHETLGPEEVATDAGFRENSLSAERLARQLFQIKLIHFASFW